MQETERWSGGGSNSCDCFVGFCNGCGICYDSSCCTSHNYTHLKREHFFFLHYYVKTRKTEKWVFPLLVSLSFASSSFLLSGLYPPPPSFLYILPSLLSVVINGGLYPLDVYDSLMGCVCVTLSWWTQRHHFPTGKSHTQTHKSSSSVKQSHLTITAQGHGEGRPKFEMNACVCPQITQCSNRSSFCALSGAFIS